MALKDDLKALIVKSGYTMTQIVEELNQKYNRTTSVQNFSAKLKRESLKYTEVEEIFDILGYSITWTKSNDPKIDEALSLLLSLRPDLQDYILDQMKKLVELQDKN